MPIILYENPVAPLFFLVVLRKGKTAAENPPRQRTFFIFPGRCGQAEKETAGIRQYEIANYARPGFESRHNSGYWARTPYLGFGPGAHSFDGNRCRSWNTPDIDAYLRMRPGGQEQLSDTEVLEEKLMLALRTVRGLDLDSLTPAERAGL